MGFVIVCAACSLIGYLLGLWQAERIADYKLEELRLEAGLEMEGDDEQIQSRH